MVVATKKWRDVRRTRHVNRLLRQRALIETLWTAVAAQGTLVVSGICAARILGVEDRGRLALFNLIPTMLVLLGSMGVPVAATYFIARERDKARTIVRRIARASLLQCGVLTVVQIAILIAVFGGQSRYVEIAAATTILLVPANLGQILGQAILQGLQEYGRFNFWRFMPSASYALLVAVLLVVGHAGLLAVTLAFVITSIVVAALTLGVALRRLPADGPGAHHAPPLSAVLRFGRRAVLGAIYPTETFQLDQASVALFLTPASLGLYVVGISFSNFPRFLAQSVGFVAYPRIADSPDAAQARRTMWRYVAFAAILSALICGGLELVVGWALPLLFGEQFRGAVELTRILLVGSFIVSVRRVLADGLRGAGYPSIGSAGEVTALVVLMPALVILIADFGLKGAALASPVSASISFAVVLAGTWWSSPRRPALARGATRRR